MLDPALFPINKVDETKQGKYMAREIYTIFSYLFPQLFFEECMSYPNYIELKKMICAVHFCKSKQ